MHVPVLLPPTRRRATPATTRVGSSSHCSSITASSRPSVQPPLCLPTPCAPSVARRTCTVRQRCVLRYILCTALTYMSQTLSPHALNSTSPKPYTQPVKGVHIYHCCLHVLDHKTLMTSTLQPKLSEQSDRHVPLLLACLDHNPLTLRSKPYIQRAQDDYRTKPYALNSTLCTRA